MRIVPVIDLMRGQVVRGVGGRRDEYRPIESVLAADATPPAVGRAFVEAGFRQAYLADLDAIAGGEPVWKIYQDLMGCGLGLLVDAGIGNVEQARRIAEFEFRGSRLAGVVTGLESLESPEMLAEICHLVGQDRLIFSLDLKAGQPLVGSAAWNGLTAIQIAEAALHAGVRRVIVLDLASVGLGQGVGTERLCREIRTLDPRVEIIAGGGVRGWDDLGLLEAAGCDAALVASALHDGRLSACQCAQMQ